MCVYTRASEHESKRQQRATPRGIFFFSLRSLPGIPIVLETTKLFALPPFAADKCLGRKDAIPTSVILQLALRRRNSPM